MRKRTGRSLRDQGVHQSALARRRSGQAGHEQVVFCQDAQTGLRAIIAIYSTALGPALGGRASTRTPARTTRWLTRSTSPGRWRTRTPWRAWTSAAVKASSSATRRGTSPRPLPACLRRFHRSLNGRYITACDIGTYSEDMDIIARECRHVTGRTVPNGGAGDSSVLTAFGVFQGCSRPPSTAGGHRAWKDARSAWKAWARLAAAWSATSWKRSGRRDLRRGHRRDRPGRSRASRCADRRRPPRAHRPAVDVYAPCALGGALDDDAVAALRARIVCGGANNQLAHPGIEKVLADRASSTRRTTW